MCEYYFENGEQCPEPALEGQKFCILHTDLPEDKNSNEYKILNVQKSSRIYNKIANRDCNFEGVIFGSLDLPISHMYNANFEKSIFHDCIYFTGTNFSGKTVFKNVKFNSWASFDHSTFNGILNFENVTFNLVGSFYSVVFDGKTFFKNVKFQSTSIFDSALFNDELFFLESEFIDLSLFDRTTFKKRAHFLKCNFRNFVQFNFAQFYDECNFTATQIGEEISIRDAFYEDPETQVRVNRFARKNRENASDKENADYYYYHEMSGKRKQKYEIFRYLEYIFIELIFGYGVNPLRTFIIMLGIILVFAGIYSSGNAILIDGNFTNLPFSSYLYFSTTTALTPGFAGYSIQPQYQFLATIEAIFGTFMWASFVVIFSRKFLR